MQQEQAVCLAQITQFPTRIRVSVKPVQVTGSVTKIKQNAFVHLVKPIWAQAALFVLETQFQMMNRINALFARPIALPTMQRQHAFVFQGLQP